MSESLLQSFWAPIKPKVLAFLTNSTAPCSVAEYSSIYTGVHNYVCDCQADICGLYMCVEDMLDEYCDSVRKKFLASPAKTAVEAAQGLAFYNARMKALFTRSGMLDRMFRPLVALFVEKINKDSTNVLCFSHKSMFIWKERVLTQSGVLEKLISSTLCLIEKERDLTFTSPQATSRYTPLIKDSITREANVSFDKKILVPASYDIYMKEFEPKYIRSIESFYTRKANDLPRDIGYFDTIAKWIEKEEQRTRHYLPQMSEDEVLGAVCNVLITANESHFIENFDICLSSGDTDHARLIYTFLTKVGRSRDLFSVIGAHVKSVVDSSVSSVDTSTAASVVDIFVQTHAKCFSLLQKVLCNSKEAKIELELAFKRAFASHDIQIARALALYCNDIASHIEKDPSTVEKEICDIATVAEYMEDKDMFFELHETFLAKRLIRLYAGSEALDRAILEKLRGACGPTFTRKMELMLSDIASSREVVQNFLSSTKLSCNFCSSFYLEALSLFENFYTRKFGGRRLTHAYQLSTVELRLKAPESAHSYAFGATALQTGILLLFNGEQKNFSAKEVADALGVSLEVLVPHLAGISKTKMIKLSSEDITHETVASFNPKFFSKKPKFVLPVVNEPSKKQHPKQTVEDGTEVNTDRLERVEAAIVHIMKARKVLDFGAMQDKVREQLSQRFLVTPKVFKKAVESLVEKGYIERSSGDRDRFRYVS